MKKIILGLALAAMIMAASVNADAILYKCYVIKGVSPNGEGVGKFFQTNNLSCSQMKSVYAPRGSYVQGDNSVCIIDVDGSNLFICIP